MQKQFLIKQLADQLRTSAETAFQASREAARAANAAETPAERRESARMFNEQSNLARGQKKRSKAAMQDLRSLATFEAPSLAQNARVALGAIVEIENLDTGEGRTLFLAPCGAGATLRMPGGDGFLTVVTPSSPIGKAVRGRRVGDTTDVTLRGEITEWEITYVA